MFSWLSAYFCVLVSVSKTFAQWKISTRVLATITRQLQNGNIHLLATELFIVKNGLSPPFMNDIFVENAQHYYDLRKKTEFKRNNVKTVYNGTETLTFLGSRIGEFVRDYIKKSNNIEEFKLKITFRHKKAQVNMDNS